MVFAQQHPDIFDGIIGNFRACTTARVRSYLEKRLCRPGQGDACLRRDQLDALYELMGGTRWADGRLVYSDWA